MLGVEHWAAVMKVPETDPMLFFEGNHTCGNIGEWDRPPPPSPQRARGLQAAEGRGWGCHLSGPGNHLYFLPRGVIKRNHGPSHYVLRSMSYDNDACK